MFAMAEAPRPGTHRRPAKAGRRGTSSAHIVDTTEGYFKAFDAARGSGEIGAPYGLVVMGQKVNEGATSFRGVPQAEMMDRLRADFDKMQEHPGADRPRRLDRLHGHPSLHGSGAAFFYAAGH